LKLFRERPNILEKYRTRFKYILVDEFQDTNWSQYELVKMIAAPKNNLTVVGDDDQSIYRFRGAAMANILEFKKDYPAAAQFFFDPKLSQRQEILDYSYEFIKLNNRIAWKSSFEEMVKIYLKNLKRT
jgi:DNA helicase-2/ATP-dependent DNA helicase PcrA